MNKRRITHASAKARGRNLQKWVCEKISKITGIAWGKDCDIESREMGQTGVDIKLRGKALELFPYAIECKNQQKWSVQNWIKQAQKNKSDKHCTWLLFAKQNYTKPIVIMDAEEFFKILNDK